MEEYGSTDFPMVRYVPYMGVIWTVNEASLVQCGARSAGSGHH